MTGWYEPYAITVDALNYVTAETIVKGFPQSRRVSQVLQCLVLSMSSLLFFCLSVLRCSWLELQSVFLSLTSIPSWNIILWRNKKLEEFY